MQAGISLKGFDIRSWPVIIDPIEEEPGSDRESLAGITEKGRLGVKCERIRSLFPCLLPSMYS
jgi:hypothetical protein